MNGEYIESKIAEHEQKINKNTEDINSLKTENATQNILLKNLQSSIDRLTNTIDKTTEKLQTFLEDEGKKKDDNWKWILSTILMPVIFFLLSKLFK